MNKLNRVMKRLGAGGTAAVVATGVLLLGVTAVGAKAGVSARSAADTSTTSIPSPTSTSTSSTTTSTIPTTEVAPVPPLDTPVTSPDLDDDGTLDQGRGDFPRVAEPGDPARPTITVPQAGAPDDSGHHSGAPDSGSPSATIDDANDDHGGDRDRSQDRQEDSTDSGASSGHSDSNSGHENSGSDD